MKGVIIIKHLEKLLLSSLTFTLALILPAALSTGCNTDNSNDTEPSISQGESQETTADTIEETTLLIQENKIFMENTVINFDTESEYYRYADTAVQDLIRNYWNEKRNIFYDTYPQKTGSAFNYWWYAHAIDTLADSYIRTGNVEYREYADKVIESIIKRNKVITNDYYDDMEWMALALLRLYDCTGEQKYMDYVETLWNDIKGGWNEKMGGGIAWRKEQLDYKNTPANAPASILAARLYRTTEKEEYLEWAKKIYKFQKENLVNQATGEVWDGINREGNGKVDKNWIFTYCHGVYIGAGVELYKITGEETYLDDAKKTASYSLKKFFDEKKGTYTEDGGGDGGLFKGILTRYLTELYITFPEMTEIREKLTMCAETLHKKGTNEEGYFSQMGYIKTKKGSDLSVQLSGVMLYEMMAKIDSVK